MTIHSSSSFFVISIFGFHFFYFMCCLSGNGAVNGDYRHDLPHRFKPVPPVPTLQESGISYLCANCWNASIVYHLVLLFSSFVQYEFSKCSCSLIHNLGFILLFFMCSLLTWLTAADARFDNFVSTVAFAWGNTFVRSASSLMMMLVDEYSVWNILLVTVTSLLFFFL